MGDMEVTRIDFGDEFFYVCDNCGAHNEKAENIKHYKTCKPGEAKFWEEAGDG